MSLFQTLSLSSLQTQYLGRPTYHQLQVASTQDLVRQLAKKGASQGVTVLANHQIQGRGRKGRTWVSLPGDQLYFSTLIEPKIAPAKLPIINIAAGIALIEALESFGVHNAELKWPNDILIRGLKVSGILSELFLDDSRPFCIILGMGINMYGQKKDFPSSIQGLATTLEAQYGFIDRIELYVQILKALEEILNDLQTKGPLSIQTEFQKHWIYQNQKIVVQMNDQKLIGLAHEIDTDGALILETPQNKVRIHSGEVSVRLH